jgi:uncharacterized protein YjbI with pentapeptide repeats
MDDYYLILGVESDAKPEAIQERFRFLAQAFHPDKYSSLKQKQLAEEEFKKINNAYQILSNPRKRADYDFYRNKPANYSRTNTNDVNKKAEETERQWAQEEHKRKAEEAAHQYVREDQKEKAKETGPHLTQEELNKLIKIRPINLRGLDLKRLDLSKADLSEANLHEAFLNEADLSDANLSKANLGGADLSGAIYNKRTIWPDGFDQKKSGAALKISMSEQELDLILHSRTKNLRSLYLRSASLHGADLSKSNLSKAYLCDANLSKANLSHADLWDANLRDANLRGADLKGTNLGSANLAGAKFDKDTKWPDGFDPIAAGAILEE